MGLYHKHLQKLLMVKLFHGAQMALCVESVLATLRRSRGGVLVLRRYGTDSILLIHCLLYTTDAADE